MTKAKHPIPDDALDDRLAGVGTSGSGKSYNLGTAIERALALKRRVGIVDPTGVWWGLRLKADASGPSPWPIVIFGGPHGDLPISENAGAIVGEACATMEESFIVDLSELGTRAGERRFMLAFYSALYRHTNQEPLILVTDEADMFAPQVVNDKEGGALKLLGILETIVRRGRVKGFIPWLITQRPAVLNKNVLSQADGLIAMKLTSSQDRAAIGAWIEGQADKAEGKAILAALPSLEKGKGYVWIPGRQILECASFPRKVTFDSGRTPARGEKVKAQTLKPLDVSSLAGKLATIEQEVAASDPAKLKARIAELERAARSKGKAAIDALAAPTRADLIEAKRQGVQIGAGHLKEAMHGLKDVMLERIRGELAAAMTAALDREAARPIKIPPTPAIASGKSETIDHGRIASREAMGLRPLDPPPTLPIEKRYPVNGVIADAALAGRLTPYQREILASLTFWAANGHKWPSRAMVAAGARKSPTSSTFEKYIRVLRTDGLIEVPTAGKLTLLPAGQHVAGEPDLSASVRERLATILTPYQAKILDALPRDGSSMTRADLAEAIEQSPTSSTFEKYIRTLRSLEIITLPEAGSVAIEPWVWL